MLALLTNYIRNIIFFLIFYSFAGIILPSGKYKSYISIVLGFILLFIVVEPIAALSRGGLESLVLQMGEQLEKNTEGKTSEVQKTIEYEAMQKELIAQHFNAQLHSQVTLTVAPLGYRVEKLESIVDIDTQELKELSLWVAKGSGGEVLEQGEIKAIKVEAIEIAPLSQEVTNNSETPESLEIKKLLSDFYNISPDNIYINVSSTKSNRIAQQAGNP